MDEATLEATIDAYKSQLQQIETVLQSAGSQGLENLLQLQSDLKEVIELTQGSLLSLRKSKLLTYVDDITSRSDETKVENAETRLPGEPPAERTMDEEFAAFQAAIADDSYTSTSSPVQSNHPQKSGNTVPPDRQEAELENGGDDDDDDDEDEDDDDEYLANISGSTCSINHQHEWGAQQRHNAVVLSLEPPGPQDEEVKVRVMFCNPTNASMKPCPFFFKGDCRFAEGECRFSHGYAVRVSELKPFQEVNLSQLSIESKCLAKYTDDIWYPASVTDIDPDTKQVTVRFESYGDTATLDAQNILPVGAHSDLSDDDEGSDDEDESEGSDSDSPSTTVSAHPLTSQPREAEDEGVEDLTNVLWIPSGPSCMLGQWESHTRGIASKLMAKMGYEIGKGLGKHGEGRTEPVEAVIVPAGKSLDMCMKLKEMKKLGIVGKKKKRRGRGRKNRKIRQADVKTTKLKKPKDVFDFINSHLGTKKVKVNELLADNFTLVQTHRVRNEESKGERMAKSRQLNVQLLKTQEEMRTTEKRLARLKQTMARNQRDKAACASIQAQMDKAEEYLGTIKASQRKLERQKNSRDEHKKLTVF